MTWLSRQEMFILENLIAKANAYRRWEDDQCHEHLLVFNHLASMSSFQCYPGDFLSWKIISPNTAYGLSG